MLLSIFLTKIFIRKPIHKFYKNIFIHIIFFSLQNMSEHKFSVTNLVQYFAEHDPFREKVSFSTVNKIYLWFEPDVYEKFKFKPKKQN